MASKRRNPPKSASAPASAPSKGASAANTRARGATPPQTRARTLTPGQQQRASIQWFFSLLKGTKKKGAGIIAADGTEIYNPAKSPLLGQMFFFLYDAKHKDTLPYWDKFPLVIPIGITDKHLLGLNLHYMPPPLRRGVIQMFMARRRRANTPQAYMDLTWRIAKNLLAMKVLNPMIHMYLFSHVRPPFIHVKEEAWINATMLPVQQFQKKTARQVWNRVTK